jgi:hypothetical protein
MTSTTANSMNFLGMEDDGSAGFRLPKLMKAKIKDVVKREKIKSFSMYVKHAVNIQLQKDLEEM